MVAYRNGYYAGKFNDLTYGEYSNYKYFWATNYTLNVTPGNDNDVVVASYDVDLSGLGGGAAVVFASGFLAPEDNQNGAAFGLFAALPDGDVVEFPINNEALALAKGGDSDLLPNTFSLNQNYPNPFNPSTTISFELPQDSNVQLRVYNVLGQEVETLLDEPRSAGYHQVNFNASNNPSGVYFYKISADSYSNTRKMMLVK